MGPNEKELQRIGEAIDWSLPGADDFRTALQELTSLFKGIADNPGIGGETGKEASEASALIGTFASDMDEWVGKIQKNVQSTNQYKNTAPEVVDSLPSAQMDGGTKTAITAGSFVLGGVGVLAGQAGIAAYEQHLAEEREKAAAAKAQVFGDNLDDNAKELKALSESAPSAPALGGDAPTDGQKSSTGPGSGTGPGTGRPVGSSYDQWNATLQQQGTSNGGVVIKDPGFTDTGWVNVDGPTHGTTVGPVIEDPGPRPPIHRDPTTGGPGSGSGGNGGLTGGAFGAGSAAALAAGSRMSGGGLGSLGSAGGAGLRGGVGAGGMRGLAGEGAGAGAGRSGAGRGLLSNTTAEEAAGRGGAGTAAGRAGATGTGGSGGMMGGGAGAGGAGGGRGGRDRKRRGLGGPLAPRLEDEEEFGPLGSGAAAGGRDD